MANNIVQGEWDWMQQAGMGLPQPSAQPTATNAISALMARLLAQQAGTPAAGTQSPPIGGQAPAPTGNPFGQLAASLPASGWSNPNAQAWTQQALSAPYLQGWNQPQATPGAGTGAPTGATPDPAALDARVAQVQQALSQQRNAQQTNVIGGFLSGLATGGPLGALTNLATSAFTANKDGWMGTGLDGTWVKETLAKYGYRSGAVPKGGYKTIGPDGKTYYGSGYPLKVLMGLIEQHGLTPKRT